MRLRLQRETGWRVVLPIVALLAGLSVVAGELKANGGTLRLANVSMGAYQVSVFTDPTPVRPDSLDVSVLIIQPGLEGVPEGIRVTVTTELLEPEPRGQAEGKLQPGAGHTLRATREQADDPRYYATKFALGSPGLWKITVEVQGDAGAGAASFEVRAREVGLLGQPLILTLLTLLPLGLAWWFLAREEEKPADSNARGDDEDSAPAPTGHA